MSSEDSWAFPKMNSIEHLCHSQEDFGQAHTTFHVSVLIIIYFSVVRAVSERSGHENTPRDGLPEGSQSGWNLPLHSYFQLFPLFSPPHSFHTPSPTLTHTVPSYLAVWHIRSIFPLCLLCAFWTLALPAPCCYKAPFPTWQMPTLPAISLSPILWSFQKSYLVIPSTGLHHTSYRPLVTVMLLQYGHLCRLSLFY